jgi:hypothetical protein
VLDTPKALAFHEFVLGKHAHMMNGCYDMHLYCDTPFCKLHRHVSEFQGRSERDTWTLARSEGWHRHRRPPHLGGGWLHFCGDCKAMFTRIAKGSTGSTDGN